MSTDIANKWLTLAANFAVLAGIGLLFFELEQNQAMIRAQTRAQIASELTNLLSQVAMDPQLSSLVRRADAGEDLSVEEAFQYAHRSAAWFRFFENVHYQYRQGLYDESEYAAHRDGWRMFFRMSATAVENWCMYREVVSAEFRVEIDSLTDLSVCTTE